MTINYEIIQNPRVLSINEVAGELEGSTVRISRSQEGWTARLKIRVNEVVVHYYEASKQDRVGFGKLMERAQAHEAALNAEREAIAKKVSAKLFTH